ncbi:MAG TPA: c-type cytochrome [Burkholderiaceae bacterium]|nr:c-type cytochrome [Burkholderiaceae bacterium]
MSAKLTLTTIAASAVLLAGAPAHASLDLAKAKNCTACHAVDKKLIGPSYKDVAAKYASDKEAAGKLATKIQKGGVGVWGQIPMPANPQVSADEASALAKWVLSTK